MHRGFVSGNKNGRGAVGLGLHFEGENYQYFKTLVFFETLQYCRKLLQLGSKPVRQGRRASQSELRPQAREQAAEVNILVGKAACP